MADTYTTLRCSNCRHPIAALSLADTVELAPDLATSRPVRTPLPVHVPMQSSRVVRMRLRKLDQEIVL
jgi:hypothetical protein